MKILNIRSRLRRKSDLPSPAIKLRDGDNVAVMGGGPAGSLFSYFLLDLAAKLNLNLKLDIYEPRNFSLTGPPGCNMCAGIISESLVQMLAVEGIFLPPTVVQRGMDSYVLYTDHGKTRFETPHLEKRIAAVFRGAGPLTTKDSEWHSFDGYLLDQAVSKGAHLMRSRVKTVNRLDDQLEVEARGGSPKLYDFLAVATGVNTSALRLFQPLEPDYQPPETVQTYVREFFLGREAIEQSLGAHTIHFFFLNSPGLDFAAIVPKGNFVTVTALGQDLDQDRFEKFLVTPAVTGCMPSGWQGKEFVCHCSPRINVTGAVHPYADRMVFLGDSGVSRLYKDGIGAAYRAAKYAAQAAVFHGIGNEDLRRHYWALSQSMERDNLIGKSIFRLGRLIKPRGFAIRTMLKLVASEQTKKNSQRRMSTILWDMFTGSSPYRDILWHGIHPAFIGQWIWHLTSSLVRRT